MLLRRILNKPQLFKKCACNTLNRVNYCNKRDEPQPNPTLGNIASKYQIFRDEEAEVILDVEEEKLKSIQSQELEVLDAFEGINLKRGIEGVFDIQDLVDVLRKENAENLLVAEVPREIQYVNYMCIVSAKSQRHMIGIAEFIRRVYKKKRRTGEIVPILEGRGSKDWLALDLGNIALHIFSKEGRKVYDLDLLWAAGHEFDNEYNKKDEMVEMLERHTVYLKDLQPAN